MRYVISDHRYLQRLTSSTIVQHAFPPLAFTEKCSTPPGPGEPQVIGGPRRSGIAMNGTSPSPTAPSTESIQIPTGSSKARMTNSPTTHHPPPYIELHARSAFSFLEGSSVPEELVARATA